MNTVTEVLMARIDRPSAWTGATVGGKEGFVYHLTDAQLDSFDDLLSRTRLLAPQKVARKDFEHPVIAAMLADLFAVLGEGRGVIVIAGLTPDRHTEEDMERIYWGCGTHWGIATTVQSRFGDLLGHVRAEPGETIRGYRGSQELQFHTDSHEIVGLCCLQKARSGGLSRLASAHAVHNEIFSRRPDLLPALYRGFQILPTELMHSAGDPVSRYRVPVFSNVDGVLSCNYVRGQFDRASAAKGIPLPDDLVEALDFLDETLERPDIHIEFMLEPGEMLIFNNWQTLHARTRFEDSTDMKRHLLRLWLSVPDGRPVIRALLERGAAYNRIHQEITQRTESA